MHCIPSYKTLATLALLYTSQVESNRLRGSQGREVVTTFRVTVTHDLVRQDDGTFTEAEYLTSAPIENGIEGSAFYNIDLPGHILSDHQERIHSGNLFISTIDPLISDDTVIISDNSTVTVLEESPVSRRKLEDTESRNVAVLRVTMESGVEVGYSAAEIEQQLFQSEVGLKNQLGLCSGGAINIVSAGVFEVTVPGDVSDFSSPASLRNTALELVAADHNLASASELADHVMVILPSNTYPGFIGNAGVNHWVSTLNNLWSLDVMVYMHEFGHNLGLGHAYLSDGSGDYSSYMSATGYAPNRSGPRKCYNAASNREMGWFDSRAQDIDVSTESLTMVTLAALGEVDKRIKSLPALLTIGKYSLQYNLASGFNVGTEILRNTVTIAHSEPGKTIVEKSGLVKGGGIFSVANFDDSGRDLRIEVCDKIVGTSLTPAAVNIGVSLDLLGSPCEILSKPVATKSPSKAPTSSPTVAPTESPTKPATDAPTMPLPVETYEPTTTSPTVSPTSEPSEVLVHRTQQVDLLPSLAETIIMVVNLAAFSEVDKSYDVDPTLVEVGPYNLQYDADDERVILSHYGDDGLLVTEAIVLHGTMYVDSDFEGSGKPLHIEACTKTTGDSLKPTTMSIGLSLGFDLSPCEITNENISTDSTTEETEETPRPTNAPTLSPTAKKTSPPKIANCPDTSSLKVTFFNGRKDRTISCSTIDKNTRNLKFCTMSLSDTFVGTVQDVCQQECSSLTGACVRQ